MAQFAPVAPVHILKELLIRRQLGMYHLLLAHDVLKHQEEYKGVFDNVVSTPAFEPVKILDNSVVELSGAVDIDTIIPAAIAIKANVIVLPDAMTDMDKTIHDCKWALDNWTPKLNDALPWGWTYMMVPQGVSKEEFAFCAQVFADDPRIGWWGVGRYYNKVIGHSRAEGVEIVSAVNRERKIHLLGFSDDIIDDVLTARVHNRNLWGIDSAVPIRAASQCNLAMQMTMSTLPPRGVWWDNAVWNDEIIHNIQRFEGWVRKTGYS